MRIHTISSVLLVVAAAGCGTSNDDARADPGLVGPAPVPAPLTADASSIVGVTRSQHVVHRSSEGISVISLEDPDDVRTISSGADIIGVRGSLVTLWSDMNWETGLARFAFWTRALGTQAVGTAISGDEVLAVPEDGSRIAVFTNIRRSAADLVVITAATGEARALLEVGHGVEGTCRPNIAFAGSRLFVAWCRPGSGNATLVRFDPPEAEEADWNATTLGRNLRTGFSTDATGDTVFFVDVTGRGGVWVNGESTEIDTGVTWGTVLDDGSAVLYTVGDQLRRATLPEGVPVPIVTNGFAHPMGWSEGYEQALYATTIDWEAGGQSDLLLTGTTEFNRAPRRLVNEPEARLPRSAFTSDGQWALFLTNGDGAGRMLNVLPVNGDGGGTIDGVDAVEAVHGSRVLFTSLDPEDPESGIRNLHVIDAARPDQQLLLSEGITDFAPTPEGDRVVFIRAPSQQGLGLYLQQIP